MKKILLSTIHNLEVKPAQLKLVSEALKPLFDGVYLTISETTLPSVAAFFSRQTPFHEVVIAPKGAADARRKVLALAFEAVPHAQIFISTLIR